LKLPKNTQLIYPKHNAKYYAKAPESRFLLDKLLDMIPRYKTQRMQENYILSPHPHSNNNTHPSTTPRSSKHGKGI
jgi:hypothetical protein